jgi:hypothetical protein
MGVDGREIALYVVGRRLDLSELPVAGRSIDQRHIETSGSPAR